MTHRPRLSEQQLLAIVETMAEGVFVLSSDGRVILWNATMEQLTGFPSDEIVGQSCESVGALCESQQAGATCAILTQGDIKNMECSLRHRDGSSVPVLKSARVLRGANNTMLGAVATMTDLRTLRRAQRELEIARATLELDLSCPDEHQLLIGTSRTMLELKSLIAKAAATEVTTLITGETGTGKELIALAIHRQSVRSAHPFVTINCGALSENLLESELFGHVKGAFTGAISNRMGRFEAASGGTIFLDEIGELSLPTQVLLLRVLQERVVERVGETRQRPVDVRVISASNKNLTELVDEGRFREDLLYRLKVFPLHSAPLRERRADIKPLVEHFVRRRSRSTGREVSRLSERAWHALMDYCWPGNVRELENTIDHAFVLVANDCIELEDLPLEIREARNQQPCRPRTASAKSGAKRRQGRIGDIDKEEMLHLLELASWNRSEVARHLGVHRSTVLRHMRKLGLLDTGGSSVGAKR